MSDLDWGDEPAAPAVALPATPVARIQTMAEPRSTPQTGLVMPDCAYCGASLSPTNSSRLRSGNWFHIQCPATAGEQKEQSGPMIPVPPEEPVSGEPSAEPAKKRGRPAKTHAAETSPVPHVFPPLLELKDTLEKALALVTSLISK